jgi:ATP-binding cassette subfamily B protein
VSLRSSAALARRALIFVRGESRAVCGTLLGSLAVSVALAVEPLFLKSIVDRLTTAGATAPFWLGVASLAGLLLAVRFGNAWVAGSIFGVRLEIEFQLRARVARKLSVLATGRQQEIGVGGLRYAIDASAPQTAAAFCEVAFKLLPTLAFLGVSTWGMTRLNAELALLVCALAPLPVLVGAWAARWQRARERMLHDFWTHLWSWYTEVLVAMPTVRAFAMEGAEERRLLRRVRWAFKVIRRGVGSDAQAAAMGSTAEVVARLLVIGYGGVLVARGAMTVGALLAFLGYVAGFFAPIQQLVLVYQSVCKALPAVGAVFDVLDADEEAVDADGAVPAPPLRGRVTLDDVSLSYGDGRSALRGLSVDIQPGETVALVGPSGSGKSSVLRLLQRLHHPTAGRVLVDGHDVRTLQAASLRRQLGVVPQDVVLFNDTVAANIAYGRPSATRAEIEAAARAADAHEFILALPRGYDAMVGEGGRALSGGQRQRIAIARAFLVDPAILLLDEATSALDAASEQSVQRALGALRAGRTTFVIAHRLNTVRDADRILVLRDGALVGEGRHEALLATCPTYASLVRLQLEGEDRPAEDDPATEELRGLALVA